MKHKHFYSHIINIHSVYNALDILELTAEEKTELLVIVENSVHHTVIDIVLTELPEEHKKEFLSHLTLHKHDEIWSLLKSKTNNIEDKILTAVENLKKALHNDIKEAHAKKLH